MKRRWIFATRNRGKLREAAAILGGSVELIGAEEAGLPEVEETGETFDENASLKAEAAAAATGLPSLADDSGLCVDALGGQPGVRSARYGGPGIEAGSAGDAERRRRLLEALREVPDERRTARFVCVVALAAPGVPTRLARGVCEGRIAREERGAGGFGYDPVFVPAGHDRTFAELPAETKNRLSHRARALATARSWT